MLTCKNNKLRNWAQMLGACVLAATLSACGGGDDTAAPAPAPAPTPATAPPAANASSGFTQSGNLNYLATADNGSTRIVAATVAYSAPNGTVILDADTVAPLPVTTADAWANIAWPVGRLGVVRANGNAGLVCRGAAAEVGMSHNMTRVTDLTVLHGRSFRVSWCSDTGPVTDSVNLTFNADGTATIGAGTFGAYTVSAANVIAEFSDAGLTEADSSNYKLRLYAHTAGGVTQYHMVTIADESGGAGLPRVRWVALWSPAP